MKKRQAIARTRKAVPAKKRQEQSFQEFVDLIQQAQGRVYQVVNTALTDLYWRVGEYISKKVAAAEWGKAVIQELADCLKRVQPEVRGFSAPNLWRMKQFHETYQRTSKLSPLVRELPWTHNLLMLGKCQRPEEREFYLRLAVREEWPCRTGGQP